jgi:hypothetical protein
VRINNLHIERKESFDQDYPNMLVGLVQIKGDHGKMEVKLSNTVVSRIFALIKEDVQRVATYNASQAGHAVEEAVGECDLLEQIEEPK